MVALAQARASITPSMKVELQPCGSSKEAFGSVFAAMPLGKTVRWRQLDLETSTHICKSLLNEHTERAQGEAAGKFKVEAAELQSSVFVGTRGREQPDVEPSPFICEVLPGQNPEDIQGQEEARCGSPILQAAEWTKGWSSVQRCEQPDQEPSPVMPEHAPEQARTPRRRMCHSGRVSGVQRLSICGQARPTKLEFKALVGIIERLSNAGEDVAPDMAALKAFPSTIAQQVHPPAGNRRRPLPSAKNVCRAEGMGCVLHWERDEHLETASEGGLPHANVGHRGNCPTSRSVSPIVVHRFSTPVLLEHKPEWAGSQRGGMGQEQIEPIRLGFTCAGLTEPVAAAMRDDVQVSGAHEVHHVQHSCKSRSVSPLGWTAARVPHHGRGPQWHRAAAEGEAQPPAVAEYLSPLIEAMTPRGSLAEGTKHGGAETGSRSVSPIGSVAAFASLFSASTARRPAAAKAEPEKHKLQVRTAPMPSAAGPEAELQ